MMKRVGSVKNEWSIMDLEPKHCGFFPIYKNTILFKDYIISNHIPKIPELLQNPTQTNFSLQNIVISLP